MVCVGVKGGEGGVAGEGGRMGPSDGGGVKGGKMWQVREVSWGTREVDE